MAMSNVLDLPHSDDLPKALARHRLEWEIPDVDADTIGSDSFSEPEYRHLGLKMFAAKQRALMQGSDILVRTSKDLQMALDVDDRAPLSERAEVGIAPIATQSVVGRCGWCRCDGGDEEPA
jgi:hypothetical protein